MLQVSYSPSFHDDTTMKATGPTVEDVSRVSTPGF